MQAFCNTRSDFHMEKIDILPAVAAISKLAFRISTSQKKIFHDNLFL